jgi:hypothetical protein
VVTGERIGAVLAMQWEWGNLSSGDVSIPAEFHKGPSGGVLIRNGAASNRVGTDGDGINDAAERNETAPCGGECTAHWRTKSA